jgi:hypothetical protein
MLNNFFIFRLSKHFHSPTLYNLLTESKHAYQKHTFQCMHEVIAFIQKFSQNSYF